VIREISRTQPRHAQLFFITNRKGTAYRACPERSRRGGDFDSHAALIILPLLVGDTLPNSVIPTAADYRESGDLRSGEPALSEVEGNLLAIFTG